MNEICMWIAICTLIVLFALLIQHEMLRCTKDECHKSYCDKLRINNYKCALAMLFLCLIFLATLAFGKYEYRELNNYISFASTVSSMILSVLAIIMTINSDAKNENVKASIETALQTIRGASEKLKKYNKELSDTKETMRTSVENIKDISNNTIDYQRNIRILRNDMLRIK